MEKLYQVDAFTNKLFSGNPAAVCPLQNWLSDDVMQKIAAENNLAETAFFVRNGDHFTIRWFTPVTEVDLCGHATLASAYVLFKNENYQGDTIIFDSPRSGRLTVTKKGEKLTLNFPADVVQPVELTHVLTDGFSIKAKEAYKGKTDYMLIFEKESEIRDLVPYFDKISIAAGRGVMVTAKGDSVDFVSRFFAPQSGINEDPVTGSAHTTLTPFWSERLGKKELTAIQLSERKGFLECRNLGDRIEISGECRLYMKGEINI